MARGLDGQYRILEERNGADHRHARRPRRGFRDRRWRLVQGGRFPSPLRRFAIVRVEQLAAGTAAATAADSQGSLPRPLHPRDDTLSTHQCLRPEDATQPWRCPDCGLLREPLPPAPAEAAKRKISVSKNTVIVLGAVAAGAVCVAAPAVSEEAFTVAMCAVILVCLVYMYRQFRRM